MARPPFVEASDGTRLFCRAWGEGAPIVFTHPWALNADIWEYQLTELSERGFRCIAFDRRGRGRSDDPGRGYDYESLTGDLAAVIERLELRDVTLVGYSMGSGEVIRYVARDAGRRIARAVLVRPVSPVNTGGPMYESFISGIKQDRPAFMAGGLPLFLGREPLVSPTMSQWVLDQFLQSSPRALIECTRHIAVGDHRAYLSGMTIPTLIVQGDKDEVNPLDRTGEKLADAIAGSELKVYPGAPHRIVLTHRERFTRDLLTFMQG